MSHTLTALQKLSDSKYPTIGLITEPPDFAFDVEFGYLTEKYDFVRIPSILGKNSIRSEFDTAYPDTFYGNDLDCLRKLSEFEDYCIFQPYIAEFALTKMSQVELYGPTVFHLPVADIRYQDYFDNLIILPNQSKINEELFRNHIDEEGFPPEVELALLETQRKYFNIIYTKGTWND